MTNNNLFENDLFVRSELKSRGDLSSIVPSGVAVEVGTHRGDFASDFMEDFGGVLYCVDPYIKGYDDGDPASHGDRSEDFLEATEQLIDYIADCRVVFLLEPSTSASKHFDKSSLDFVYIDARHKYDSVLEDLYTWYHHIKRGGFIAGHDISDNYGGTYEHEVRPAVTDFVTSLKNNSKVNVIVEENIGWSYYIQKT